MFNNSHRNLILIVCSLFAIFAVFPTHVFAENFNVNIAFSKSGSISGLKVYAFTESGSYTGQNSTTDSNGTAVFDKNNFADGSYKFRLDYLTQQFWSETATFPEDSVLDMIVEEGDVEVNLKNETENISGVKVYLFNGSGSYLGQNRTTDSNGLATYILPVGMEVKFRADILGYQFWSESYVVSSTTAIDFLIPYQDVTITVNKTYQTTSNPLSGVKVFLFTATGSYLNKNLTTDSNGQVSFSLPLQSYKVRADYLTRQYWSNEFTGQDTTVQVPMAQVPVTVTNAGLPLESVPVNVFLGSGTYLNINGTTDSSGTANFELPADEYKFRTDYLGSQYWSDTVNVLADQINEIVISTGGGSLELTLLKDSSATLTGVSCYLFDDSDNYLNLSAITDDNGKVVFNLADGSYKIRADYLGYQFWSSTYVLSSSNLSESLSIQHQDIIVTVEGGDPLAGPLAGVPVYLFKEDGTYLNQTTTTDENGLVQWSLPNQPYKVRADYMDQQYWSIPFQWESVNITVPMSQASVTVTGIGQPMEDIPVYVFDSNDNYMNITKNTDSNGTANFILASGDYRFRADYQSKQFWSITQTLESGQTVPVEISTGGGTLTFKLAAGVNEPLDGVHCYVFKADDDAYLGLRQFTDINGEANFQLADGDYKIRVDYLGYEFWSPVYSVTDDITAEFNIPHQNVQVTVEGMFSSPEPLSGVPLYLFTESGTYLNQSRWSDLNGQAVFRLPVKEYKFRADYQTHQYWSPASTSQNATISVPLAGVEITVQGAGQVLEDVPVYVFTGSDNYLNLTRQTNSEGIVTFRLSAGDYRFRADYQINQVHPIKAYLVR